MVNNYKVQDALKKPNWLSKTQYGQPAEMVYRLLTVPMEYSTFATTAQLGENPEVGEDINLEFSMDPKTLMSSGSRLTSHCQFTITSTVGLEVISMDTCLRFPWRLSTPSSGFTTGKSILTSTTVSLEPKLMVHVATLTVFLRCGKGSTPTSGSRRAK